MKRLARSFVGPVSILAVAAIALAPASSLAGDMPRIRLGSDTWPPFTGHAGETRLALDLAHKALERAGIGADTIVEEWKDVAAGLRDGRLDGSAAIWRNAERDEYLLFSEPYLENRLVLVGGKGSDVSATSLADLGGKTVAVVAQYAYGDAVVAAEGPRFIEGPSDQSNLQKLLAGEVDYMLADELLIRHLVEHDREKAKRLLQIGDTTLVRRPLHLAVRREHPDAAAAVEKFNAEIERMQADGTYNVILRLDWIRADVDGDGRPEFVARGTQAGEVAPTEGYSILSTIPRESSVNLGDGYFFGGRVYDSWEDVPERYKTRPPDPPEYETPPALLRF